MCLLHEDGEDEVEEGWASMGAEGWRVWSRVE